MNFSTGSPNLLTMTRYFLAEPTEDIWTDVELQEYINRGYLHIVAQTDYIEEIATASAVDGQQFYALPTNCIKPLILQYDDDADDDYDTLKYCSFKEIYRIAGDDLWTKEDTPKRWFIWRQQIGLEPIPDTTVTDAQKLIYVKRPTELSASTDSPDIPDQFQDGIIFYAAKQACIKARRFDDLVYFDAEYQRVVRAMKAFMSRKSKDKVHQVRKYGNEIDGYVSGILRNKDDVIS